MHANSPELEQQLFDGALTLGLLLTPTGLGAYGVIRLFSDDDPDLAPVSEGHQLEGMLDDQRRSVRRNQRLFAIAIAVVHGVVFLFSFA